MFYGFRTCEDSWRTYGDVVLIGPDDAIQSGNDDRDIFRPNGPESHAYLYALRVDLEALNRQTGTWPFRDVEAIALVRVDSRETTGRTLSLTCDSLSWALGQASRVPRRLDRKAPSKLRCETSISPGDTLLVPVPRGFSGGPMDIAPCLRGLKVEHGFVPELGVYLHELDRAFVQGPGGFSLRRFLKHRAR